MKWKRLHRSHKSTEVPAAPENRQSTRRSHTSTPWVFTFQGIQPVACNHSRKNIHETIQSCRVTSLTKHHALPELLNHVRFFVTNISHTNLDFDLCIQFRGPIGGLTRKAAAAARPVVSMCHAPKSIRGMSVIGTTSSLENVRGTRTWTPDWRSSEILVRRH